MTWDPTLEIGYNKYNTALAAARMFLSKVSHDLDSLKKVDASQIDISNLAFAASNLIFASELYLKLVLMLEDKYLANEHNLWTLFTNVAPSNQRSQT